MNMRLMCLHVDYHISLWIVEILKRINQTGVLHNLPDRDNNCYFPDEWQDGYSAGWNACLDIIIGEENRG